MQWEEIKSICTQYFGENEKSVLNVSLTMEIFMAISHGTAGLIYFSLESSCMTLRAVSERLVFPSQNQISACVSMRIFTSADVFFEILDRIIKSWKHGDFTAQTPETFQWGLGFDSHRFDGFQLCADADAIFEPIWGQREMQGSISLRVKYSCERTHRRNLFWNVKKERKKWRRCRASP